MSDYASLKLGATYLGNDTCGFCVWAPFARSVAVRIVGPAAGLAVGGGPAASTSAGPNASANASASASISTSASASPSHSPSVGPAADPSPAAEAGRLVPLDRDERGYHRGVVSGVAPGSLYYYRLDGKEDLPDPASRHQPRGVHGPSRVVDPGAFSWSDRNWLAPPQEELVIYELHMGTFTPEGTFEAVILHLDDLRDLGVNAVELMPVAQFSGTRNWGYDGVYPFAVHDSYGGPDGLRLLVNECHRRGLAVILDVVYNHLGPEGNYLGRFGPYFTDRYRSSWGQAMNFDGPGSDEVRRYFIENALEWVDDFHVDGLRLDAVHAIIDMSAVRFLEELAAAVHRRADRLGRRVYVIAESDLNDPRIVRPPAAGGYGLDAQWCDDFHHALHCLLTGEREGYYQDFGALADLAKAFREGYVYTGQYSRFRKRSHGSRPHLVEAPRFVVFSQNHDQVGNRARGERLSTLVSFDGLKLAAAAVILSPYIPLLFMGEEYGETAPFQYFTSHQDPDLAETVRKGRREEFAAFGWKGEVPDPQDPETFLRSRLQHDLRRSRSGRHRVLLEFYRELIRLRRTVPALSHLSRENLEVVALERGQGRQQDGARGGVLLVRRWSREHGDEVCIVFSFGRPGTSGTPGTSDASLAVPFPPGRWNKVLDTEEERWLGRGSSLPAAVHSQGEVCLTLGPEACAMFRRVRED
ncbi:MAG: maltooligosyltrehalose trehalohydrolase [Bacillota bacterium]|nr:maltooligosyltrehalose trehalohydrolase [Bacillota bacterium]